MHTTIIWIYMWVAMWNLLRDTLSSQAELTEPHSGCAEIIVHLRLFCVYRTSLDMLVTYVTITNIVLYKSDEKFAEIWLFNKNTLKKCWFFGSWRDNLWRCAIVMAKRCVFNITGMDFRCHENQNIKQMFWPLMGSESPILTLYNNLRI